MLRVKNFMADDDAVVRVGDKNISQCNRWLANSSVNPATGKTIKEGAKVWTALKQMCSGVAMKKQGDGELRISVKNAETREKVKDLLGKNPRNNWKVTSRATSGAYIIVIDSREEREEALKKSKGESLVMDLKQFKALAIGDKGADDDAIAVCKQWRENPLKNPKTGRAIKEGGKVWLELRDMCDALENKNVVKDKKEKEGKKMAKKKKIVFVEEERVPSVLDAIEEVCLNHEDPVTFDAW